MEIAYGIPKCDCGQCIDLLENEEGEIIVSMESLRWWFSGFCPKARNPDPPPDPGPGFPIAMAA